MHAWINEEMDFRVAVLALLEVTYLGIELI